MFGSFRGLVGRNVRCRELGRVVATSQRMRGDTRTIAESSGELRFKERRVVPKEAAPSQEEVGGTSRTLKQQISSFAKQEDYQRALSIIKEAPDRAALNLFTLLVFLYSGKEPMAMVVAVSNTLRERNIGSDVRLCNTIIRTLLVHRKLEEALETFDSMRASGFQPDVGTYNLLVDALCHLSAYDRALQMITSMRCAGLEPDQVTYSTLIQFLCLHSRTEEALKLFNSMQAKGQQPSIVLYNSIIRLLCSQGRSEEALQIASGMKQEGTAPTIHTYELLAEALTHQKEPAPLLLLAQIKQEAQAPILASFTRMRDFLQQSNQPEQLQALEEEQSQVIEAAHAAARADLHKE